MPNYKAIADQFVEELKAKNKTLVDLIYDKTVKLTYANHALKQAVGSHQRYNRFITAYNNNNLGQYFGHDYYSKSAHEFNTDTEEKALIRIKNLSVEMDASIKYLSAEIERKRNAKKAKLQFSHLLTDKELNPIYKVVQPLKEDAIKAAEQFAKQTIENVKKELKEAGNDLNICAPYPSRYDDRNLSQYQFMVKQMKHNLFTQLTTQNKAVKRNEPCYVEIDPNKVKFYIKQTKEHAAVQFDNYVDKLITKIGPVKSAELDGNFIWFRSFLTVITESGEHQIWKTQRISNISKFGLVFNQFPTRKVQSKK